MTLQQALGGWSISRLGGAKPWRHPWHVAPVWNALSERWVATVKPGLVNGRAPIWRTTVKAQAETSGRDFGTNPLTGRPYFSDPIFSHGGTEDTEETVTIDVPLYLGPSIALTWRAVGFDGDPSIGVPDFFLRRGAAPAALSFDAATREVDIDLLTAPSAPEGLRLLRVCDVWLHQPRAALTSTATIAPGLADGLSNVTIQLGERSPLAGDTLRVMAGDFDPLLGARGDALANDFEEPAWDEILIARVWLLSQPGAAPYESQPDGSWTPFVQHRLFWNLRYDNPVFAPQVTNPDFPFLLPLAGGVAQPIVNFVTASLNDGLDRALNILQAHSLAGTFWTIRRGTDAHFPPAPVEPPKGRNGADKSGRLVAEAIAAERAPERDRLDPDFPYISIPMPSRLLKPTL